MGKTALVKWHLLAVVLGFLPATSQAITRFNLVDFSLSLTRNVAQVDGYFVYGGVDAFGSFGSVIRLYDSIPAGTSSFNLTLPLPAFPYTSYEVSLFSVYNTELQLVSVLLKDSSALGQQFETYFAASAMTETSFTLALKNGDIAALQSFFDSQRPLTSSGTPASLFPEYNSSNTGGTLINFSGGTLGGSASLIAVPEASSLALLTALGGLAVATLRLRSRISRLGRR